MSQPTGLAALALFAGFLFAQQPTIRTTVPLVTVPVSVTDSHARSIYGLEASDFVLRDDGKPRPVRVDVVDYGLAPVALVTAVQTSGMSLSALAKIRKVGSMITGAVVGANGEGAVLTFGDEVKVAQDFTADPDLVEKAFRALKPEDTSAASKSQEAARYEQHRTQTYMPLRSTYEGAHARCGQPGLSICLRSAPGPGVPAF